MLTHWRMEVTLSETVDIALTEMDRAKSGGEPYATLLVDVGQQTNESANALDRIFRHALEQKLPFIVLKPPGWKNEFLPQESQAFATIEKPVRESRLFETIQSLVGMSQREPIAEPHNWSAAPPLTPESQGLHVLLVDDNRINQTVGARLMTREGHQVTVAASGEEALALVAKDSFDVCLMDIEMPGMDGLETTKVIRARELKSSRQMPIIALTAHAMKGDRERCLEAGMNGYVSKPIHAEELRKALAGLTRLGEAASSS
jgi:CheY-like chemotaxis protein